MSPLITYFLSANHVILFLGSTMTQMHYASKVMYISISHSQFECDDIKVSILVS